MTLKQPTATAFALLADLAALFPRWKNTDAISLLWARDIDRWLQAGVNTDQIRAVIEQHRRERKGNDPDLAACGAKASEILRKQHEARRLREGQRPRAVGPERWMPDDMQAEDARMKREGKPWSARLLRMNEMAAERGGWSNV